MQGDQKAVQDISGNVKLEPMDYSWQPSDENYRDPLNGLEASEKAEIESQWKKEARARKKRDDWHRQRERAERRRVLAENASMRKQLNEKEEGDRRRRAKLEMAENKGLLRARAARTSCAFLPT